MIEDDVISSYEVRDAIAREPDKKGFFCGVPQLDAEKTFNMGIGMFAVVPQQSVDGSLEILGNRDVDAWVCGSIRERVGGEKGDSPAKGGGGGAINLVGNYEKN